MAVENQGAKTKNISNKTPNFLKYSIFLKLGVDIKLNNKRYSKRSLTAKAKNITEI